MTPRDGAAAASGASAARGAVGGRHRRGRRHALGDARVVVQHAVDEQQLRFPLGHAEEPPRLRLVRERGGGRRGAERASRRAAPRRP
jgi:hypothetical protein